MNEPVLLRKGLDWVLFQPWGRGSVHRIAGHRAVAEAPGAEMSIPQAKASIAQLRKGGYKVAKLPLEW